VSGKVYNSVIEAEGSTLITPPIIIAGKACMMECVFATYNAEYAPDPALAARQSFQIFGSLTDQRGQFYDKTNGAFTKRPALANISNYFVYSSGPQLVQIPNGPFEFKTLIRRPDGGMIASNKLDGTPTTNPNIYAPSTGIITCVLRFTLVE
jgi:hypothetical protein